jgi:hypothetical protein
VKGATVGETLDRNRLTTPLWREHTSQPFAPISWERAFSILVERIQATLARKGPQALAIYGSGQFLNEDYYVANKLLKGALGSNNFDANSRLCMSSAVAGYARSLGSDGPPCCYDDLDLAELVLLIGTNTAECHPVLFQRLLKRRRKGAGPRLICTWRSPPAATWPCFAAWATCCSSAVAWIRPLWRPTPRASRSWRCFGAPGRRRGRRRCAASPRPTCASWPPGGVRPQRFSASGRWG